MTTKNSRDLLDWYREWAAAKYVELGVESSWPSNMNIPLNNDNRVRAGRDFMLAEEARLIALWDPAMDAFWPAAIDEIDADVALMPPDIAALFDAWADDPDTLVRELLKAFYRAVGRQIAMVRSGV